MLDIPKNNFKLRRKSLISKYFNITKIRAIFLMILMGFMFIKCEFSGADEIQGKKSSPVRSIELESVTVTAQKQEEKLQEIPVSITVFTDQDIEDKKIESLMDMADYVPNLMIFENGASGMNSPSMRGGPCGSLYLNCDYRVVC